MKQPVLIRNEKTPLKANESLIIILIFIILSKKKSKYFREKNVKFYYHAKFERAFVRNGILSIQISINHIRTTRDKYSGGCILRFKLVYILEKNIRSSKLFLLSPPLPRLHHTSSS